jgi:hypothetical protein
MWARAVPGTVLASDADGAAAVLMRTRWHASAVRASAAPARKRNVHAAPSDRREKIVAAVTKPGPDPQFFKGLAYALTLSAAGWALVALAVARFA